jgi:hypothetical protein
MLLPDPKDLVGSCATRCARRCARGACPRRSCSAWALGCWRPQATGAPSAFLFGPFAALYTLLLGPLPWRALVPLEADGRRGEKLVRWCLAGPWRPRSSTSSRALPRLRRVTHSARVYALGHAREVARGLAALPHRRLGPRPGHPARAAPRPHPRLAPAPLRAARRRAPRRPPRRPRPALPLQRAQRHREPVRLRPRAAEDNIVRLSTLLRAVLDTRRSGAAPARRRARLARDYVGLLRRATPRSRWCRHRAPDTARRGGRPAAPPPAAARERRPPRAHRPRRPSSSPPAREGDDLVLTRAQPRRLPRAARGRPGIDLVRRRVELAWGERRRVRDRRRRRCHRRHGHRARRLRAAPGGPA